MDNHLSFVAQAEEFLAKAKAAYPDFADITTAEFFHTCPAAPLPTQLGSVDTLTAAEANELKERFERDGIAPFDYVAHDGLQAGKRHPIIRLASTLPDVFRAKYPIDHPMEQHQEARKRFGEPDGTLKFYNLPLPTGIDKYREQAETDEMFDAHNDGLGYGGLIVTSIIMLDSAPRSGGFTYFANLVRSAIALGNSDYEAFRQLFLPDAISALRPRGKGAIQVTSPVLYLNDEEEPQIFYRRATGEYSVIWRSDQPALQRAQAFLERCTEPFGPGSLFVDLQKPGQGVIVNNRHMVHGRTAFVDTGDWKRVLARKWYVPTSSDADYRHVPGMNVSKKYAQFAPDISRNEYRTGEWTYDEQTCKNTRVSDDFSR